MVEVGRLARRASLWGCALLLLMLAAGALWWHDIAGTAPKSAPATVPGSAAPSVPPATKTAAAQPAPSPTTVAAPPIIPVVQPKIQTVTETLEIIGNAASVNTVKLIARVDGYLEQIHFEDGAIVKKNDLLFTVQQEQYKAQLQQAQAQLQLQQATLAYDTLELHRYTALLKHDAATQVDVDHWNFERESALANILSAQAQIELAQLNLGYTEVRAPFDGLMGKHLIDPDNVVGGNMQQTALAEIMQLDPIYVEANISEQQALQIRANLDQRRLTLAQLHQVPVDVALSDETGFPHHGTLEYVAPGIDPSTGTLFVRGILRNTNLALLPGMFVKMRLPMGKTIKNAPLVPDSALQADQGGRYLLTVDKDDVIRQTYVQLGELVGGLRVITSGLKPGDRVVVGELWRATPGMKVTPQLTTVSG